MSGLPKTWVAGLCAGFVVAGCSGNDGENDLPGGAGGQGGVAAAPGAGAGGGSTGGQGGSTPGGGAVGGSVSSGGSDSTESGAAGDASNETGGSPPTGGSDATGGENAGGEGGDPVPPRGGLNLEIPGGMNCPVQSLQYTVGAPAPDAVTPGTPLADGEQDAHVTCQVAANAGSYSINVHITQSPNTSFDVVGVVMGSDGAGTGTISAYVPEAVAAFSSQTACTLQAVSVADPSSGDAVPQVEPGSAWVRFDCTDLFNPPLFICAASGYFFVTDCEE